MVASLREAGRKVRPRLFNESRQGTSDVLLLPESRRLPETCLCSPLSTAVPTAVQWLHGYPWAPRPSRSSWPGRGGSVSRSRQSDPLLNALMGIGPNASSVPSRRLILPHAAPHAGRASCFWPGQPPALKRAALDVCITFF